MRAWITAESVVGFRVGSSGGWSAGTQKDFSIQSQAGWLSVRVGVLSPGPWLVFFYPLPCSILGLLLPMGARGRDLLSRIRAQPGSPGLQEEGGVAKAVPDVLPETHSSEMPH